MTTFLTRFFSLWLLLLIHMLDTCLALLNVMAIYAIAMPCVRVQNLHAHVATPMKIHFCSQCYDQSFSVATATMHGAAQHQSSRHVPVPRVIIAIFSILPSLKLDMVLTYMHTEASSIVQQKKLGS